MFLVFSMSQGWHSKVIHNSVSVFHIIIQLHILFIIYSNNWWDTIAYLIFTPSHPLNIIWLLIYPFILSVLWKSVDIPNLQFDSGCEFQRMVNLHQSSYRWVRRPKMKAQTDYCIIGKAIIFILFTCCQWLKTVLCQAGEMDNG